MSGTRSAWIARIALAALLGLSATSHPCQAAPPWQRMVLFKKVEADPNKEYHLTEDHGPWLILAVTFSGKHARDQANELVHVLRSEFKLPAYTHKMEFDYSQGEIGRGVNQYGEPRRMKYRIGEAIEEIGVLVGDFPTVDDPEARRVLERLKYSHPPCLDPEEIISEGQSVSRPLASYRIMQRMMLDPNRPQAKKGPMGHAFVIANPLIPAEYFRPGGVDKFVEELNRGLEYSLLDCRRRYTVKVATYTGTVVIDQKKIKQIEEGGDLQSRLEQAAMKAHKLALALRAKGYEAYEFHDRSSSIVTVGSFDSVGEPREDGKIEINPQVHRIMETFGAEKVVRPGQAAPELGKPTKLGEFVFDSQPLPVEVPRRSIASDYTRRDALLSR